MALPAVATGHLQPEEGDLCHRSLYTTRVGWVGNTYRARERGIRITLPAESNPGKKIASKINPVETSKPSRKTLLSSTGLASFHLVCSSGELFDRDRWKTSIA